MVNKIVPTFIYFLYVFYENWKTTHPHPFSAVPWNVFVYELSPVEFRYDDTMRNYLYTIAMQITRVFLNLYL